MRARTPSSSSALIRAHADERARALQQGLVGAEATAMWTRRSRAPQEVQAVYELPLLAHATLEPHELHGRCRRQTDAICMSATQVQQVAQGVSAKAAALKLETGALVHHAAGRRLRPASGHGLHSAAAVEASKAVGRPVKMLWTREDDTHPRQLPSAGLRSMISGALRCAGQTRGVEVPHRGSFDHRALGARGQEKQMDPFGSKRRPNYPYDAAMSKVTLPAARKSASTWVTCAR